MTNRTKARHWLAYRLVELARRHGVVL